MQGWKAVHSYECSHRNSSWPHLEFPHHNIPLYKLEGLELVLFEGDSRRVSPLETRGNLNLSFVAKDRIIKWVENCTHKSGLNVIVQIPVP
jgi:hypothetical protein